MAGSTCLDNMTAEQPSNNTARQAWMAVLARATAADLEPLVAGLLPRFERLRGPEIGLVMLQGRAGRVGQAFNLGEATVARCTVRTESGAIGHAYRLGRDLRAAELAAALDAALQDPARTDQLQAEIIQPLAQSQGEERARTARRAAATEVQFFTLAIMRGA